MLGLTGFVLQFQRKILFFPIDGGKRNDFHGIPSFHLTDSNTYNPNIGQHKDLSGFLSFAHPGKAWLIAHVTFEGDLLSAIRDLEFSVLSASILEQSCWFRNKITQPCHPVPLSFQDCNLLMDSSVSLVWMGSILISSWNDFRGSQIQLTGKKANAVRNK